MPLPYLLFIIYSEMKVQVKRFTVLYFLILLLFTGCTKEAEREFPRVRTLPVGAITDKGVILRGEITNYPSVDIEEYGFLVAEISSVNEDDMFIISPGNDPGAGIFEAPLTGGIEEGKTYSFVAYAISNGVLSVGSELTFESQGSDPPLITGFSPTDGMVGDTVEISCSNILGPEEKYTVSFGLTNAEIVFFSDTLIKAIVPLTIESRESTVSITGYGESFTAQNKFVLLVPVIESFSPGEAYPGEEVIITGSNFHPVKEINKVLFNDTNADILGVTSTTLTVKLPEIPEDDAIITVLISGQSATSASRITVLGPEITYFEPLSGTFLEEVHLYGEALLMGRQPEVYFNNSKASIISSSDEEIIVLVPVNLSDQESTIKLVYAVKTIEYSTPFTFVEPEGLFLSTIQASQGQDIVIRGAGLNPVPENNTVVINGTEIYPYFYDGYQLVVNLGNAIPVGTYDISINLAGSILPVTNQLTVVPSPWERVADFPGGEVYKSSSFVLNGEGYAGTGTGLGHEYVTGFWKYSPGSDTWTQIEDFTGQTRIMANSFSIEEKGYVGGGFDLDAPWRESLEDYYSYMPSEGWVRISDYPYYADREYNPWMSTVNNKRYFSAGITLLTSFEVNPENWTLISGTPSIAMGANSFVINDRIYVIDFDRKVREYNPSLNQWTQKNDFPGPARSYGVGYSNGEKGYYGLGYNYNGPIFFNDIWEYDPVTDLWTKSAPFTGDARNLPFWFVIDNYVYIGTGYNGNRCVNDVYRRKLDF